MASDACQSLLALIQKARTGRRIVLVPVLARPVEAYARDKRRSAELGLIEHRFALISIDACHSGAVFKGDRRATSCRGTSGW